MNTARFVNFTMSEGISEASAAKKKGNWDNDFVPNIVLSSLAL
jgi:hypothetical protein